MEEVSTYTTLPTDKFTHFPSTYGDKVISIAEISESELMVSLYTKGIFPVQ